MKNLALIFSVILAFAAGVGLGNYYYQSTLVNYVFDGDYEQVSLEGLVPIEAGLNGTTVRLIGGCREISFDITPDQAYSIARGIEKILGPRPLTHDIMKDVLDNFGVEILQIKIDRYQNSIYYATIILRQDNRLLELDARPSDSIALSLRTGTTLYIDQAILEANGAKVC